MALDLVTMGRTLVDLYPVQDGPLEQVTSFEKAVGGSPTNVAIAASRLGRRTGVVSRVGDDAFGRYARGQLEEWGIDVTQVLPVPGGVTPVAICEISPPESPLTIYRPDPPVDTAIQADELDRETLRAASILWITLSGLSAEPSRSAHHSALDCREPDAHTVVDLDYRPAFWSGESDAARAARDVLGRATVLVGNLEECRIVTGATAAATAADALLGAGAQLAIIKLGGDGVLAATADERVMVAPIPVRVTNGLGSGDAFGGTLCHALLAGWDLNHTLTMANAAGALVASRRGCSVAMPTLTEIEDFATRGAATSRRV
jgi:5-dehydro-2-deoxygluconokinase